MIAVASDPLARAAIDRFLAFYAALVEAKKLAASVVAEPAPGVAGEMPSPAMASASVLADVFVHLRCAICPAGSPPPSMDGVPDVGYVMAALADEVMLHHVDWSGRSQWTTTLLESSLYGSKVSGEEIFTLARAILDGRIIGRGDMVAAILLALSTGFRGRWRHVDDRGAVDELRRQLYEHVYHVPPHRVDWHPALPAALLTEGRLQRVPRVGPWVMAIGVTAMLTLAASHVIWTRATADVLARGREIVDLSMRR